MRRQKLQGVDPGAATVDVDAVAVIVEVSGSRASATGVGERPCAQYRHTEGAVCCFCNRRRQNII